MKAVIWTDVLQALVMFVGLFLTIIQGEHILSKISR
jgi:Na+/proline symporter